MSAAAVLRTEHRALAAAVAAAGIVAVASVGPEPAAVVVLVTVGAAGLAAPAETPAAASRRTWMAVTMAGTAAFAAVAILAPATPQLPLAASAVVASVIAAVAEEAFFRRFLYGFLSRWGPALAVLGSAAAFALAHAPRYGWRAVSLDLGAGVVFGWQRWATGRWTSPAATHVVANLMGMGVLG